MYDIWVEVEIDPVGSRMAGNGSRSEGIQLRSVVDHDAWLEECDVDECECESQKK